MKCRRIHFFFAFALFVLGGQSGYTSGLPAKILEIFTNNSGFYFPYGKVLYAAVFSDGELVYTERTKTEMVVQHRHLTSEQMNELRNLLNTKGMLNLSGLVFAEAQPVHRDYQTNLEVSIQRKDRLQEFILRGFEPEQGRAFPNDFGKLVCFVDDIRDASYRVSSGCK